MPGLNLKAAQWEQQHKTHVEEYLRQIEALYDVASDELIRLGMGYKYQPNTGRLFAFSSNKSRSKQADASLSSFRNKLSTIITAGITSGMVFCQRQERFMGKTTIRQSEKRMDASQSRCT